MKIYLYFLTVLFVIHESAAVKLPFYGSCRKTKVKKDFEMDKVTQGLKQWYLYKTDAKVQKSNIACGIFTFKYDKIKNENDLQISAKVGGAGITLSTILNKTDSPARFKQKGLIDFNSNLQILDTDYKEYLVLETCDSYKLFSIKKAFILTASKEVTKEINDKALKILKKNKFNTDAKSMYLVDQKNCD